MLLRRRLRLLGMHRCWQAGWGHLLGRRRLGLLLLLVCLGQPPTQLVGRLVLPETAASKERQWQ